MNINTFRKFHLTDMEIAVNDFLEENQKCSFMQMDFLPFHQEEAYVCIVRYIEPPKVNSVEFLKREIFRLQNELDGLLKVKHGK